MEEERKVFDEIGEENEPSRGSANNLKPDKRLFRVSINEIVFCRMRVHDQDDVLRHNHSEVEVFEHLEVFTQEGDGTQTVEAFMERDLAIIKQQKLGCLLHDAF